MGGPQIIQVMDDHFSFETTMVNGGSPRLKKPSNGITMNPTNRESLRVMGSASGHSHNSPPLLLSSKFSEGKASNLGAAFLESVDRSNELSRQQTPNSV